VCYGIVDGGQEAETAQQRAQPQAELVRVLFQARPDR
jgi:hypothetical protein